MQARVGDTIGGVPVVGDDFDVDEYIKSFEDKGWDPERDGPATPAKPRDPEIVRAGKLIEDARKKDAEDDDEAAEEAYDLAIEALRRTRATKKLLSAGYFARAQFWEKRRQDGSAVRDFTRAIKHLDKNNTQDRAELLFHRATCRHRLQQLKSALGDFDKAIGILEALPDERRVGNTATYAGWQTNRGLVLADMGNYTAALAAHDRAIEANPNVTVAWSNRAGVYEHLKRWEEATRDYTRRIELNHSTAGNAYLHRGFCRLHLGTGARELAISDMVAACELGLDFGCKNAKALGKELRR